MHSSRLKLMTKNIVSSWEWIGSQLAIMFLALFALSTSVDAFDPGTPLNLSRISTNNDVSSDFKISPDGKIVVYRARATQNGDRDLFSVTITGGEPINLTSSSAGDVLNFSISNDSRKIVYRLSDPQDEPVLYLATVPNNRGFFISKVLSGSFINTPAVISKFLISSDSSHVVYQAKTVLTPEFRLYSAPLTEPFSMEPIIVSSQSSGAAKQVIDFQFVPDQNRIVYLGDLDEDGKTELYAGPSKISRAGEKLNVNLSSGRNVATFDVSPDGNYVVYIADARVAGLNELYSTSLLVPEFNKLNPNTIASTEDIFNFKISPNSQRVVYKSNERNVAISELYSVPINNSGGTQSTLISLDLPPDGDVQNNYIISPNSTRVVYTADLIDDRYRLFSTLISSRNTVSLTPGLGAEDLVRTGFTFDQSGARVVYQVINLETIPSVTNIYSVRVAGGDNIPLSPTTSGQFISALVVHPELNRVFYIADQRHNRLFELFSSKVAGPSSSSRLINTPFSELSANEVLGYAISNDGKFLVYLADQDTQGKRELYSVDLTAGSFCFPIKARNSKVATVCL